MMYEQTFKSLAREMNGKSNGGSSVLLLTIMGLISAAIFWASITELDSVVRGSGKTTSETSNQLVQSAEPGVLSSKLVKEGDTVRREQILFEIDPVDAKSQLDRILSRRAALSIKVARLNAEIQETKFVFSGDLDQKYTALAKTEQSLYDARRRDLITKISMLEERRKQKINEIEELEIEYESADRGGKLIDLEISTIEPLVKSGLAPETRLITLQREKEASNGIKNSARAAQVRVNSGLREIDEQIKSERQQYYTSALSELSAAEAEIAELETTLPSISKRLDRTTVRSPVDGIINRINYNTLGAYVNTGDILAEIVPINSALIVEAKIDPKDIRDVVEGQNVKISLTSYDVSRYGRLDGTVIGVSADAIADPENGRQYYSVDVDIISDLYEADGTPVVVLPGMQASIDVLAGKRTVLQYLWEPVAKTKSKALRD